MALLKINPTAIGDMLGRTAGAKIAASIAQAASPKFVRDVQRVLDTSRLIGDLLGTNMPINGIPLELLGGLSLQQAKAIHSQMMEMRVARKSLFFIRITDENPPIGEYQPKSSIVDDSLGGLVKNGISRIGAAAGSAVNGIAGAVNDIAGKQASMAAKGLLGGVVGGLGLSTGSTGESISQIAVSAFDLLAMDVNYSVSLQGDHQQIGSGFIDKPTGISPAELSITTMDDQAGTIKRWFDGKQAQVAHIDGTMGLPAEYLVTIEVVHAVASEQVANSLRAYSYTKRYRANSRSIDLSRRDQGLAEVQLNFTQFDNFMGV
ncbi:hypothetical protein [Comamonas sp. HJ-2]